MRGVLQVISSAIAALAVAACGGDGPPSPPPPVVDSSGPTFGVAAFGSPEAVHPAGLGRDTRFSADGRFIGVNRVVGDLGQVVLIDVEKGTEEIVSLFDDGSPADALSFIADVSTDGRYVLFTSQAELVPGVSYPAGGVYRQFQVFLRDRLLKRTEIISLGSDGSSATRLEVTAGANAISEDGRHVAFTAQGADLAAGIEYASRHGFPVKNIYVRDRVSRTTEMVSVTPDGKTSGIGTTPTSSLSWDSTFPVISRDGRFVAFTSFATNLVADATYSFANTANVFVRDRLTATTRLVNAGPDGRTASSGPCWINDASGKQSFMSDDGSQLVFNCEGGFLADDLPTKAPERARVADVYLWDSATGSNVLVSRSFDGREGSDADAHSALISADGRFVTFLSAAANLVTGFQFHDEFGSPATNVYRYDRLTGKVMLVSAARLETEAASNAGIEDVDMSADGQTISFLARATNLAPLPLPSTRTHVYVWRQPLNELKVVSLHSPAGNAGASAPGLTLRRDGKGLTYIGAGFMAFDEIFYVELNP